MEKFYIVPDITEYKGLRVQKDTKLEYKTETIEQVLENLTLVTIMNDKGDGYDSKSIVHVYLSEEDILLFDEKRGYFKPGVTMQSAEEIINDFKALID